jgi:hypothetical protein
VNAVAAATAAKVRVRNMCFSCLMDKTDKSKPDSLLDAVRIPG